MPVEVRVISWNLQHTMERANARIALLKDLDDRFGRWDVLCAQEVTPAMSELLVGAFEGDAAYFFGHGGERERAARSAAMVLARRPWSLSDAGPLASAPSVLRSATAVLTLDGEADIAVASGALPPASMPRWGTAAKVAQAHAFREWLEKHRDLPAVIGIDANGPLRDTVEGPTFHDERERVLFGFDEAPLIDSFRAQLTGEECDRLRRLRPDGPLVVTHMAGGRAPRRYDHILTRGCAVVSAGYVVADALAAGSDHAVAHARLRAG